MGPKFDLLYLTIKKNWIKIHMYDINSDYNRTVEYCIWSMSMLGQAQIMCIHTYNINMSMYMYIYICVCVQIYLCL